MIIIYTEFSKYIILILTTLFVTIWRFLDNLENGSFAVLTKIFRGWNTISLWRIAKVNVRFASKVVLNVKLCGASSLLVI